MATLTIKESREFVIFQAFAKNDTFRGALSAIEEYDKANPDRRIFAAPDEKKAMRDSFKLFKDAEKVIARNGTALDYDDPLIVDRLNTILSQNLPVFSKKTMKDDTSSISIKKANIGRMMAVHAHNVKTLGNRLMKENKERQHEAAMVAKHGITGHSPYEKVISNERTYKSNTDILVERLLKEQRLAEK